jgi:small subunit ribosomal protein S21
VIAVFGGAASSGSEARPSSESRSFSLTQIEAAPSFRVCLLSAPQTPRGGKQILSEVIIHDDENFERALKRFKKKCEKAGILSDLRKHRHYEKPSERRKRKLNTAMRKNRRTRTPR